jgi:hypothetical protein
MIMPGCDVCSPVAFSGHPGKGSVSQRNVALVLLEIPVAADLRFLPDSPRRKRGAAATGQRQTPADPVGKLM